MTQCSATTQKLNKDGTFSSCCTCSVTTMIKDSSEKTPLFQGFAISLQSTPFTLVLKMQLMRFQPKQPSRSVLDDRLRFAPFAKKHNHVPLRWLTTTKCFPVCPWKSFRERVMLLRTLPSQWRRTILSSKWKRHWWAHT